MHRKLEQQVKKIEELKPEVQVIEIFMRYGYLTGYNTHTISHITPKRGYIITTKGEKLNKFYNLYIATENNMSIVKAYKERQNNLRFIHDITFDNLSDIKLNKIVEIIKGG